MPATASDRHEVAGMARSYTRKQRVRAAARQFRDTLWIRSHTADLSVSPSMARSAPG